MTEHENRYVLRQLKDIVADLVEAVGNQTKLGKMLGITQGKVSQLKRVGTIGSDWQEHFRISVELAKVCSKHGVSTTELAQRPSSPPTRSRIQVIGKKKRALS